MPINPTTLKTQIDTEITNETVDFAITPAEVGGRLKDSVDYTTEQSALAEKLTNKSTNVATDGSSNTKYPSVKAVKDYADGLVVGLLDDRGNYDASTNLFPATGGSGVAGAVMKGDLWYISVTGTLGGSSVPVGASVRALADTPGQTAGNWSVLNVGIGFTPENEANKSVDVVTDAASDIKYPSVKAVKTYVDANVGTVSFWASVLSQSGTSAPTGSVVNNSGITFTWGYSAVGIYVLFSSVNLSAYTCILTFTNPLFASTAYTLSKNSTTTFRLRMYDTGSGTPVLSDGLINGATMKIELYS